MRTNALIAASVAASVFVVFNNGSANAQTPVESVKQPVNVVVQPGDSLSKIATGHQTTYTRLYDANTEIEHPDVIHPGENVRIPAAEEQIPVRPLPGAAVAQPASPAQKASPRKKTTAAPAPSASDGGVWDRLAQCEAGGNWSINTGNGYYGGLQFSASSWRAVGGSGLPHQASKSEQIARGEMLKARQGWGAWPSCSSKLGLR